MWGVYAGRRRHSLSTPSSPQRTSDIESKPMNRRTKPVATAKTLAILDEFEEWGWDNPAMAWEDVLRRLARAHRLVTPSGIPVSKAAAGTLAKCKLAFQRGARSARKNHPTMRRTFAKLRKQATS